MIEHEPNLIKLEEMTHYILDKCQSKRSFGKTVLFKLLYFSDFNHYKKHFEAISNERYKKLEHGPAPVHFDEVLKKLHDEEKIYYKESKQKLDPWIFKSLKKPATRYLSDKELETIDLVVKKVGHLNATQISKLSHEDNPYKASKLNEVISYGLVFYRKPEIETQVE